MKAIMVSILLVTSALAFGVTNHHSLHANRSHQAAFGNVPVVDGIQRGSGHGAKSEERSSTSTINSGDTSFVIVAMALVVLMTPGLAFFYAGLLRTTSVISMLMLNFWSMGMIFLLWYVFIFSLGFGDSWYVIGNPWTYFGFRTVGIDTPISINGVDEDVTIPGTIFAGYMGVFAVITPALMTGAFADRFFFTPYVLFLALWEVLVYAPVCHMIWGGGLLSGDVASWLHVYDFAGGIVVHVTAGFSALVVAYVVGRRSVPDEVAHEDFEKPHNVPFVFLGTALLWFGWFGFNAGSALSAGSVASMAAINTHLAASTAVVMWVFLEWLETRKKPSLVSACVGAIAGLATVTPCAGYIQAWAAFVLGLLAPVVCLNCNRLLRKMDVEDALDVWGVHGMGGYLGVSLLGLLADESACETATYPTYCVNPGTITRSWSQFAVQWISATVIGLYSMLVTWVLLKLLGRCMTIVPKDVDQHILDKAQHDEDAYFKHKL